MYLCFSSGLYTMQSTYLVPWSTLNCKPRLGDGQGGLVKCKNQSVQFLDLWAFVQTCLPCALMVSLWVDVIYTPPPSTHYNTTPPPSDGHQSDKGALVPIAYILVCNPHADIQMDRTPQTKIHVLSPRALCKLQLPA